jgi:CRISPR-associated protein Cas2
MWIFAIFDLPVDTKEARRHYSGFRKNLLKDGFTMLQYSVYVRHCRSLENTDVHYRRVKTFLPPDGEVRMFTITEKQFSRMQTYIGKVREQPEATPSQIEMF